MTTQHNPEIVGFIDVLAETGSHYRIEEMEDLYTEDLGFLVVTPEGGVARFSKQEMLAEFGERRAAGDPPQPSRRPRDVRTAPAQDGRTLAGVGRNSVALAGSVDGEGIPAAARALTKAAAIVPGRRK
jgi:hypothetical protein